MGHTHTDTALGTCFANRWAPESWLETKFHQRDHFPWLAVLSEVPPQISGYSSLVLTALVKPAPCFAMSLGILGVSHSGPTSSCSRGGSRDVLENACPPGTQAGVCGWLPPAKADLHRRQQPALEQEGWEAGFSSHVDTTQQRTTKHTLAPNPKLQVTNGRWTSDGRLTPGPTLAGQRGQRGGLSEDRIHDCNQNARGLRKLFVPGSDQLPNADEGGGTTLLLMEISLNKASTSSATCSAAAPRSAAPRAAPCEG